MQGRGGRLRLRARLLAASSYLCLALLVTEPSTAEAYEYRGRAPVPGFYNHGFISVEGGFLFNGSEGNLAFNPNDTLVRDLPTPRPGGNGVTAALAFGWRVDPAWDWAVRYRHNAFSRNTESVTVGSVTNRFRYQSIDGEVGFRPPFLQMANLRVFAGPRVLNAQNDISFGYNRTEFLPIPVDKLGSFEHDMSLWGFGPRVGLDASLPLGDWPVMVNFSGSGSVLFSRVNHRHAFSFNQEDFLITHVGSGSTRERSSRTVYNLEGSVSVSYRIAPPVVFHFGYQAAQWWHLNTSIIDATNRGLFQTGRSNVFTHGPFVRVVFDLP